MFCSMFSNVPFTSHISEVKAPQSIAEAIQEMMADITREDPSLRAVEATVPPEIQSPDAEAPVRNLCYL